MSKIAIAEPDFFEVVIAEKIVIKGGSSIVPDVVVAYSTSYDTRNIATQNISGDLISGFKLNILSLGSATAAAAAAVSIGVGGYAIAITGSKA